MGRSVNKVYRVLMAACALAIWTSAAQENSTSWVPVKFPSGDEQKSIPRIAVGRLSPRGDDSIIFTRDHLSDREDKDATNDARSGSLQVCN